MPVPRGRKSRPTMCSSTEDLPEDCDPITTICGRSNGCFPMAANTSWSLFTMGIRDCMPRSSCTCAAAAEPTATAPWWWPPPEPAPEGPPLLPAAILGTKRLPLTLVLLALVLALVLVLLPTLAPRLSFRPLLLLPLGAAEAGGLLAAMGWWWWWRGGIIKGYLCIYPIRSIG